QFAEHSYGFRHHRGTKDALRRGDRLVQAVYGYTVDVDLKYYFHTIHHALLTREIRKYVADNQVIESVEKFLKAEVMDSMEHWTPTAGAPQGAIISPLLSNLYLNELDHLMASEGYEMTRYADDFVIQCQTREEAEAVLARVTEWCTSRGLTV